MTTLRVGIATYEEMKARTMAIARGERRVAAEEPKVWFTSTESFAKLLSAGNRELLAVIAAKNPGSLDELARLTGRAKSNLSRTLRTMEGYGLVRLDRGDHGRVVPKMVHDQVELVLPLAAAARSPASGLRTAAASKRAPKKAKRPATAAASRRVKPV